MQCVTAVDGLWLAELGPIFFSVKDSNLSRMVSNHKTSVTGDTYNEVNEHFFLVGKETSY